MAGAIGSIIPRLAELLNKEYMLQKGVKPSIESLMKHVSFILAHLEELHKVPRDQLDGPKRQWVTLARELLYDIEDVLDTFAVRVVGPGQEPDVGFLTKMACKTKDLIKKAKTRRKIAGDVSGINNELNELKNLRESYKVDSVPNGATSSPDPRAMALYHDMTQLVGIDKASDEVINMLSPTGHDEKLKIISIVGFGGMGKTTLAKFVHDKLMKGKNFQCGAFVSVGQNPEPLEGVLMNMISRLSNKLYKAVLSSPMDRPLLIHKLRHFLQDKRYFIIIDDIWAEKDWNNIKHAFIDNNLCSRLITTTRKVHVSQACCGSDDGIYRIQPLSTDDSKVLFYRRIFHHKDGCPHELEDVSKDILKKCGGAPLAILTIASLLAKKQVQIRDEWYKVVNSIGRGLTTSSDAEGMRWILYYGYNDLPSQLKACLLYLSIFPEDYHISRDRLVRMWIAEGIIIHTTEHQQQNDLVELGESYFYDLMNSNMIQPGDTDDWDRSKITTCRVHDMVLDLIYSLAKEENFVTVLDRTGYASPQGKIHRLSLQTSSAVHTIPEATVPKVRSLFSLSSTINMMPAISCFKILRVLSLDDCEFEESFHLKHLGKLFHLRYLRLSCSCVTELPKEIGNLEFLEALDISGSSIQELPPTIVKLRRLKFLGFSYTLQLIGGLTSLQELSTISIDEESEVDILKALGNLTELRDLDIRLSPAISSKSYPLYPSSISTSFSIPNLTPTTSSISIFYTPQSQFFFQLPFPQPQPPSRACRPTLDFIFPKLPVWFNSPLDLQYLCYLSIQINEMCQEDVEKLGRLPVLGFFEIQINMARERPVIGAGAFPCVRDCRILEKNFGPVFQPGAMPKAEKLMIYASVRESKHINFDLGLGSLPSLEQVIANLFCEKAQDWEVKKLETMLRKAADIHPKNFYLNVIPDDRHKQVDVIPDDEEQQVHKDTYDFSENEDIPPTDGMSNASS
ncbi:hypothetical protein GQ55_8G055600 [Panicum hallii var. hallii]|uniref:NB-ARC domain-containing protein n=1 Tax=Panicum hallii var. hallii TaxID=1504633 RepID=A0A2T7CL31_9POAL|nr:hypothetical protein GQ55_8G055600 [Panicum hallii var. hallii]